MGVIHLNHFSFAWSLPQRRFFQMSQENASIDINAIAAQLAQQQQMIQQLLSQSSNYPEPIIQDEGMVTPQPFLHELPVRPSYEWQPPQELYERVGSLSSPIFKQMLSDEDRKSIIEKYPAIQGLKYSPPSTVPEAQRRFNRGQAREDAALRNLQYSASAILRPFDTLCHELLKTIPSDESERLFAIVNDARTLILHHCGAINNTRVNLALRAVNPTINLPDGSADYIMDPSKFQETLTQHTTYQKAIKDATFRRSKQVFYKDSTQGSGGSPASTFNTSAPHQTSRLPNTPSNHSRHSNNNSYRPNRHTSSNNNNNNNSNNSNNNRQ
jgi:hypothetical protein